MGTLRILFYREQMQGVIGNIEEILGQHDPTTCTVKILICVSDYDTNRDYLNNAEGVPRIYYSH